MQRGMRYRSSTWWIPLGWHQYLVLQIVNHHNGFIILINASMAMFKSSNPPRLPVLNIFLTVRSGKGLRLFFRQTRSRTALECRAYATAGAGLDLPTKFSALFVDGRDHQTHGYSQIDEDGFGKLQA